MIATAANALEPSGAAPSLFDDEFLRKLERLELIARRALRGLPRGEHTTARRGRGLEFHDHRGYQPGDDFRYIDWNIFSRLDQLVVKLYTTEEDMALQLVVDASLSMAFGAPAKFDYARRLAAALGFIGLNQLDRVALCAFAGGLGATTPPLKSRRRLGAMLEFLGALECAGETRLGPSLRELAPSLRGPQLVAVITDLAGVDDLEDGLDALRHRGHDVVLLHLLAESEIAPALDGPLELVDAETGATIKVTVDAELRALYQRKLATRLERIASHCRRTGVEYLRASTGVPFEDVLLRYLRRGLHLQ